MCLACLKVQTQILGRKEGRREGGKEGRKTLHRNYPPKVSNEFEEG
jgi:hypothetical protein